MKRVLYFALTVALLYALLVLLVAFSQRSLIYFPSRAPVVQLLQEAAESGAEPFKTSSGQIIGWRWGNNSPKRSLLVFHGNAGLALHRRQFAELFRRELGWEVVVLEYPGYGARPGSPSEKAFAEAADEALQLLGRGQPVYVCGESIGSGVAAGLAARHPDQVAGLLLITPMTSLANVAAPLYPFLPVRLMLRDRYEVTRALEKYAGPVAVVVAGVDTIVPADLGREVHERYTGPKRIWTQEGAGHNSLDFTPASLMWSEVAEFLKGKEPPQQ